MTIRFALIIGIVCSSSIALPMSCYDLMDDSNIFNRWIKKTNVYEMEQRKYHLILSEPENQFNDILRSEKSEILSFSNDEEIRTFLSELPTNKKFRFFKDPTTLENELLMELRDWYVGHSFYINPDFRGQVLINRVFDLSSTRVLFHFRAILRITEDGFSFDLVRYPK